MNAILSGYAGKTDMLRAVFGSSETEDRPVAPEVQTRPLTEDLFDALFH